MVLFGSPSASLSPNPISSLEPLGISTHMTSMRIGFSRKGSPMSGKTSSDTKSDAWTTAEMTIALRML